MLLGMVDATLVARAGTQQRFMTRLQTLFLRLFSPRQCDQATMKAVEKTASLVADIGETGSANTENMSETTNSPGHAHAALRALVSQLATTRRRATDKQSESKERQQAPNDGYGRSQLTQLLSAAIGGDCKTTLLIALSPTDIDQDATSSALGCKTVWPDHEFDFDR